MLYDLLKVPYIILIDKQVTIEIALVDSELKFFKEYLGNSNQIKIINQEYENI